MGKKKDKDNDATTTINGIAYEPYDLHGKKVLCITDKSYEKELERLQLELVKLQEWVKAKGLKVVVIFEGRDAAGKGGVIKRITEAMNPRICRVEALPAPTPKETSQWYFQRYVAKLPAAGEIVLFDRSWYNRAGVERVMGFSNEEELREFLRACPEFEKMLIRSGIILIKYWFSVSDEEQEKRFIDRINDPAKRWKLSPMDLAARSRWSDYSRAKDEMFSFTDTKQSPWYVVDADIKKHARLNCISHLLSMIPYEDLTPEKMKLPPRQDDDAYVRPPLEEQTFVPLIYGGSIVTSNTSNLATPEKTKDIVIGQVDKKPKKNDDKAVAPSEKANKAGGQKKSEKKEDAAAAVSSKKGSKK